MAERKPGVKSIDYTSKDFDGFREAMLNHAAQIFPEWTGRSTADFGVTLVEVMAYLGDILSYYQDAAAREAFLSTATRRESILELARMLGYTPDVAAPAAGSVVLATEESQAAAVFVPSGTRLTTDFIEALDRPLIYETMQDATLAAAGGSATIPVMEGETAGTTPLRILRNTAEEQEITCETLGVSTGSVEQAFVLAEAPVVLDSIRVFVDEGSDAVEWQQVTSLLEWGPLDKVFQAGADGRSTTLVFGDGLTGSVPSIGQTVYAAYRTGGGTVGNIQANSVRDIMNGQAGVYIVSSSAMTGGRDPESLESIRVNAPKAHRTQDRAVSQRDYADLALSVPGVAKARALSNATTSVNVRIVGAANAIPTLDLIDKVERFLQGRAVAGVRVSVSPGDLVKVNMGKPDDPIVLGLYPNHRREDALRAGKQALQQLLSDASSSFGMTIPISRVYRILDGIPGVEYARISLFARADGVQSGAQDVICRDWEIPVPGDLYIVTDGGL
ncbi:hypothetical protein GCM10010331_45170 [Streptomyces xanthochromogenes]|uniref:baseplate J/gp47 family protein n=1 Tax=Streptomyces xanthochromogenes TaxID=67384 RepID=UPI00167A7910|nr:baseplate J/gp47 family protein [Streptomyces xanthochromogenes]GHB52511.1 hypothetical protein GCM10010331_45170 [Streptomyces xanthochromogenes]